MSNSPSNPEGAPVVPAHVRELYEVLGGEPVLLPIPFVKSGPKKGPQKGPMYDEWQKVTYADSRNYGFVVTYSKKKVGSDEREVFRREKYLPLLHDPKNNIGVLLGEASMLVEDGRTWHLCSIDVDEDAAVADFVAANPVLAFTLQTVGSRGRNFWVWVEGEHPNLAKLFHRALGADGKPGAAPDPKRAWGEWRAQNGARGAQTVIWGTHPKTGRPYRREVDKPPVRIRFEDITWPEGLHLPWAPPVESPEEAAKKALEAMVKEHGEPYTLSKKGKLTVNQTFFAAWYVDRHKLVYCPEEGCFYAYQGPKTGLWSKHTGDAVRKELSTDVKAFADMNSCPQLTMARTAQLENAITQKIRGFSERWDAFARAISAKTNRARAIVHLKNAMLDLDQDPPAELPFAPEFMSRNQLQVALDPAAQCPRFLDELLGPALHVDDVLLLRKIAGQIILGVNLAQKICILTGLEGRGKSTFVKVMQRVIGEVNCGELRTKHLAERFEVFRMLGKSLLVGNDVPGNFMMIEGAEVLKSLVGGDLKDAEPKNGNEGYRVRGEFNILITCNTRLRVRLDGDAGAWRRRLILLPYSSPPPKRKDPLFVEKLVASEASGILNWMIEGAVDLLADIEECGDIKLTAAQKDRVESLLAESDSVRDFVRRGCAKAKTSETVTGEALGAAYVTYCERRGWSPMPSKVVERILPDALLEIHQAARSNDITAYIGAKAQRGYRGLRIREAGEIKDDATGAAVAAPTPPAGAPSAPDESAEAS